MELEVKYNPNLSDINVARDVLSLLNQLSECYNSKVHDLEARAKALEIEREAIKKAIKDRNYEALDFYFNIDRNEQTN